MTLAILIFVVALALIASDRADRAKVALIGAVLVLLTRTIDEEQAIDAVDWETLGLLLGMMIVVRVTSRRAPTRGSRSAPGSSRAGGRSRSCSHWR